MLRRILGLFRLPPDLEYVIKFDALGSYSATRTVGGPDPLALCQICLAYVAKIRWVLSSEQVEVQQVYREVIGEVLDFWPGALRARAESVGMANVGDVFPEQGSPTLIDNIGIAEALSKSGVAPGRLTEEFRVALRRAGQRPEDTFYVINTLPRPGVALNIPRSVLILIDSVYRDLNSESRAILYRSLSRVYDAAFSVDQQPGLKLSDLKTLYRVAAQSLQEASLSHVVGSC